MKIRRNLLWCIKLASFLLLLFCGIYIAVKHKKVTSNFPYSEGNELEVDQKHSFHEQIIGAKEGPGDLGQAYYLPPNFDKERDRLYRSNGFNARASDDIALNRSLPDIRHPKCKAMQYPGELPLTSVIVPFFNEHLSTLLRTLWSVINRSPSENLLEVILVDDASDKDFLKDELDHYIKNIPKVQILHLKRRAGLIRARLAGAKAAKGEVIIFLDSHSECTEGWLPPLLSPIKSDYRTCVCPFIDVIDYETFAYRAQDEGARGAFDWELYYKRLPLLEQDKRNLPSPFKSPVMAGGLFAISAKFFWELGGYDSGLEIWGGEQYELSFKIWQCGGVMIDVPCSHIGHIYRKFAPFSNPGGGDFLGRNYKRVAEVWMDEYAQYVYKRRPHYKFINTGDLTEQRAVRERLKCKPFKWFMTEVAFDLVKVYPPVEPPDFANGTIQSVADPHLCIDSEFRHHLERFGLRPCSEESEQVFRLTWHKDVRPGKRAVCWDVSSVDEEAPVLLYDCHGGGGNQMWKYEPDRQRMVQGSNERCLDSNPGNSEIFVTKCHSNKTTQRWIFKFFDAERIRNWDHDGLLV